MGREKAGSALREPLLRAENVSKRFGPTLALDRVSLEVRGQEIHALVGGNGSGKSTLLKILAGVYGADTGLLISSRNRHNLSKPDPAVSRRFGLHFVHQQPTTFGYLTVAENLSVGSGFETGAFGRVQWKATRRRARQALDDFAIPADPDDHVGNLSPAAQTMVEIARALQNQSGDRRRVLVLDEPTASLGTREVELLLEMLRRQAASGQAIVFVSHRLDEVLQIADRITVLRDGRNVTTVERQGLDREALVELIVGHSVETYYPDRDEMADREHPMLEVTGLNGGKVRDFDLRVARGEIIGLAGLAGSGRSTLLRLLFGAQRRRSGSIRLDGEDSDIRSPAEAIRSGVGLVAEDRRRDAVLPGLSVAEQLSITNLGDYWHGGVIRRRQEKRDAEATMKRYLIRAPSPDTPIDVLSGGNQQKVVLARWLQRNPRLLLLDEPTHGVDIGARAELWTLIQRAGESGTAAIVVSSDLEELTHLCARLIVIRDGQFAGELAEKGLSPHRVNHMLHQMTMAP